MLQSSNKQMSGTSIQDSLGKTVRIGVASNIPSNIDFANIKIYSVAGTLEKDTNLARSASSDTLWYETSILPKGEHSVIANIFIHGGNTLCDSGKITILAKEYALSITAVNGSVTLTPALVHYDSGSTVGLKAHPNTGYHFVNWSGDASSTSDSVSITMNSTKNVTANFEVNAVNMFALTITSANGSVTKTPDKTQYDSGSTVSLKANPNAGYHFVSWSGDASGTSDTATVIMKVTKTVTANFAINTYQLTISAGTGGTITAPSNSPVTVNYGVVTTITASPSVGYNFSKWTITSGTATIADVNSASTNVTLTSGDATVQANFAITYTVTYNGNGNTGGNTPIDGNTYTNGQVATVLDNTGLLVRTGCIFAGWNTNASGTGTDRTPGGSFTMGSANVTLFAKWSVVVTFNSQGGNAIAPLTVTYGSTATAPANPTKTNCVFASWYSDSVWIAPFNFSTPITATITLYAMWEASDIDGNIYHTVKIGPQVWMVENLKTTRYNDGTPIPLVTDRIAWVNLTTPGYCWYNNDISNKTPYGALYNWYAVNTGKLATTGWHVATDAEWTTLTTFLGGAAVAGGKLKEAGFGGSPDPKSTNEVGFTAVPNGNRDDGGIFSGIGGQDGSWSFTPYDTANSWVYGVVGGSTVLDRSNHGNRYGFSVRCIHD